MIKFTLFKFMCGRENLENVGREKFPDFTDKIKSETIG